MSKLYYNGHGSLRIETNENKIIYIDPYAGDGYDKNGDIILVTHNHFDHTKTELINKNPNYLVITSKEALKGGEYNSFFKDNIKITAVQAYNKNHPISECVGYVIEFDKIKFYAAGDTSLTEDMKNKLPEMKLDYAALPIDGVFNMDVEEASECARLINASHVIPIHSMPQRMDSNGKAKLFDEEKARKMKSKDTIIIKPGEEINL